MMPNNDEWSLQPIAEFEKMLSGFGKWGSIARSYYDGMIAAGFSPEQSFQLLRDWLELQWDKILWPDNPPVRGTNDR